MLARHIVHEHLGEDQIAALLEPLCQQADAAKMMQRELRKAGKQRERLIRQAARSSQPQERPHGMVDLRPGQFVTALMPASTPPAVNGHDVSFDPHRLRKRSEDA
jgi:hypothetical protein